MGPLLPFIQRNSAAVHTLTIYHCGSKIIILCPILLHILILPTGKLRFRKLRLFVTTTLIHIYALRCTALPRLNNKVFTLDASTMMYYQLIISMSWRPGKVFSHSLFHDHHVLAAADHIGATDDDGNDPDDGAAV